MSDHEYRYPGHPPTFPASWLDGKNITIDGFYARIAELEETISDVHASRDEAESESVERGRIIAELEVDLGIIRRELDASHQMIEKRTTQAAELEAALQYFVDSMDKYGHPDKSYRKAKAALAKAAPSDTED